MQLISFIYRVVQAVGDRCTWNGRFRDVEKHLRMCAYDEGARFFLAECTHCKIRFKPRALAVHDMVFTLFFHIAHPLE
jgi:hypothetical protein